MHGRYGYYHLGVFPGNQIHELAIANNRFYQLICRLHLYIWSQKSHRYFLFRYVLPAESWPVSQHSFLLPSLLRPPPLGIASAWTHACSCTVRPYPKALSINNKKYENMWNRRKILILWLILNNWYLSIHLDAAGLPLGGKCIIA